MKGLGLALALLFAGALAACSAMPSLSTASPPPTARLVSPSPSPAPSWSPAFSQAPAVPDTLQGTGLGSFRPLRPEEFRLIGISPDAAQATVRVRLPIDEGGGVVWLKLGCTFLAWYEPRPMSYMPIPPPPFPVYIVQLIGDPPSNPPSGSPGSLEAFVMVNASTGERGATFGGWYARPFTCT